MISDAENHDRDFREFLTGLGGKVVIASSYLSSRNLTARISVLLMVAICVARPKHAIAGCGCDKPPPGPAAVIPGAAFPGMSVTFFDPSFVVGQRWNITFNSGAESATVSAPVEMKRDITDKTGTKQTPQLRVTVPGLPPGPHSIHLSAGTSTITIPADSFVVIGQPVDVGQQSAEIQMDEYTTAVGLDGTLYLAIGGLNQVCDAMSFQAELDGYPLRFSDSDVLIFNSRGYFIDSLTTSVSHSHFSISPGDESTSNALFYYRHSFAKYCADHQPGGPKEVDPMHPNWHLDGTPHVDYSIVIFAINGHFDNGSAQRPGAVSVHLDLRTSLGNGTEAWESEQPEEEN
jgi:hypothetical protein